MHVAHFIILDIRKISISIITTRAVSASITKLNGNYVSKRKAFSSSLGTASTSNKLPGSTIYFIERIVSYFIHCISCAILRCS